MMPETFESAADALAYVLDDSSPGRYIMEGDVLAALLFSLEREKRPHLAAYQVMTPDYAADDECDALVRCGWPLSGSDRHKIIDRFAGAGLFEIGVRSAGVIDVVGVDDPAKRCMHVRQMRAVPGSRGFELSWYVKPADADSQSESARSRGATDAGRHVCAPMTYGNVLPYHLHSPHIWSPCRIEPGTCSARALAQIVDAGTWRDESDPGASGPNSKPLNWIVVRNATSSDCDRNLVKHIEFKAELARARPWVIGRGIMNAIREYENGTKSQP